MNTEIFSLISGKISPPRSEMVEILQGLKFPSPPCNPEDLQDCHHQFGDLDKWASYLGALEPLALWCCVVCGGARERYSFFTIKKCTSTLFILELKRA